MLDKFYQLRLSLFRYGVMAGIAVLRKTNHFEIVFSWSFTIPSGRRGTVETGFSVSTQMTRPMGH